MILLFFIFGLCMGSFYNVLALRIPAGESLFTRSHCTACNRVLNAADLVPVFSYILLRGRCRYCGSRISGIYPAGELFTGLGFAACYVLVGFDIMLPIGLGIVSAASILSVRYLTKGAPSR
ncbi:Type 4 prepilin-like proteins leader peptide-processing enzyme [Koleobacter methoxysyntrophicus]|uniref:Type 4 prepilin-like proteins leader peptide-processing enzyme n=1 Tax=Koleobacter methoxysyntrophicus TaxID=2751313 RepID=A0A8A0RSV7_9FIRM|nr:prepilin peptidase [Koleobacter methoxysyntrophicus]QSQ10578.1 Type 4 prepilin-like proteins leader peptide-processing enzyme [Koleobacter methoxysyntrophicus]